MAKPWASKQTGFTIVELLIVIVVIGILAAITIVAYNGIQERARDIQRQSDIAAIGKALQIWSINSAKSFEQMNTGYNSMPATGYYNSAYESGESVQQVLVNGDYIPESVEGEAGARYMLTRCTDAADGRRVVLA
ncbi:MAG TPA: prepilin-type N-terminal cleavage/methylation domain-containing protein, partial [Candidatus Saccharimonadales bacterium]|nr:prepilin-type N-terminal cleavage/methylation domain-containing protein [Candidatus Saccharimonadales bacterium]